MGRPEGALKASLSLVERVLMKDIVTPVPAEEVKSLIRKCLESAALVNYTKISAQNKSEGKSSSSFNRFYLMLQCIPSRRRQTLDFPHG